MKITIVGAGPVGLLTACLLSSHHQITVVEKRIEYTRRHSIKINEETIQTICDAISDSRLSSLVSTLQGWSNQLVDTCDIQDTLTEIATTLGVTIIKGVSIESLESIRDSFIIGADGARSTIRHLAFNNDTIDHHTLQYMAQLKYKTPIGTKPRSQLIMMAHSFLNGITGDELVLTFESLSGVNTTSELRKSGTLHIPIPQSVFEILTENSRGNFNAPWTPDELSRIFHPQVQKLNRIINRYGLGVSFRGGWLEDPKITVIPLSIYRSRNVYTIINNKLVVLVGDSSSTCVFERGLNKGFLEAVKLSHTFQQLSYTTLNEYAMYTAELYEHEKNWALQKAHKIDSISKSTAISSKLVTLGLLKFISR